MPITAGITSNMAINGNAAAPIIFLVIFNAVQFALRFWLMNWSYKLGTSAIDALTANMQAFTRAASIMGVFVVGCLVVTMGGTQINLQIPNGTTVTVFGQYQGWYVVLYGESVGYANAAFIQL